MRFRPCIDIHNGKVKQIVGGSLKDQMDQATENFVSEQDGSFYARLYRENQLKGGHIIILNPSSSSYYPEDIRQARLALETYPGGLQVGGGITPENASQFLAWGASHVIVTSYVFQDGMVHYDRIRELMNLIGKEHLVLDLSCRKRLGEYYIVTNRWQTFTEVKLTKETLDELSCYCDEFLIHAVDVEGKANGIETELVQMLSKLEKCKITYAGGVGSFKDLEQLKKLGKAKIDVTIGSALDLFGGTMEFHKVLEYIKSGV